MRLNDRNVAIQSVAHELAKADFIEVQVQSLMKKYQALLDQWLVEYLQTGSHLTPADFADEIQQAEEARRLIHA